MKLTKSQFDAELKNPAARKSNLIIFGMSASGKTHWSKLLAQKYGYVHIEFDHLIGSSEELAHLIRDIPGKDVAEKMGNYFGMPWSEGFQAKESAYLDIERKLMAKPRPMGSILDLTGSCIYHPEEMRRIQTSGLAVYLETSMDKQKEMLEIFLKHPKPVCWNGVFEKSIGETNELALARCYPLLLASRAQLYQKFADVTLLHDVHRNMNGAEEFVQKVKSHLP